MRLRQVVATYYFWPGVALFVLATFFAGWATTLTGQDWLGQVIWSAFFGFIALTLFVLAYRETRVLVLRSQT